MGKGGSIFEERECQKPDHSLIELSHEGQDVYDSEFCLAKLSLVALGNIER